MALIELDLDAPTDSDVPRPPFQYRWAGLVLVAVLLLTLGGAVRPQPTMWQPLGSVPMTADGAFTINGGHLYTLDGGAAGAWTLASPPARAWGVRLPPAPSGPGQINVGARLVVSGGTVLTQSIGDVAVALDPKTGRELWRPPAAIEMTIGGVAVARDMKFRPGDEYNQASGDPGALYLGPDGTAYTEPPRSTDVRAFDLVTGRTLWTLPASGSVYVAPAGEALLIVASDRVALIDPATGRTLHELTMAGLSWGSVAEGLVLVRQGDVLFAYDATTLAPRWQAPAGDAGEAGDVGGICHDLVCRPVAGRMEVLDPATGAVRWMAATQVSLRRDGNVVLMSELVTQKPIRLVDAGTGALIAKLGRWETVAQGDRVLLSRGEWQKAFAVVRPGGAVTPVGQAERSPQDCRISGRFVACRTTDTVDLFTVE